MANSKVKKGFLYYLIMFCALVLGVACILVAILIFNPGKDVFGIGVRFVNVHTSVRHLTPTNDENTRFDNLSYDRIIFNSNYTNFSISYDTDEAYTKIMFHPNVTALTKQERASFDVSIEVVDNALVINVVEPELWIGFSKKASLELVCPRGKTFENYSLTVNTKSGAVNLGDTSNNSYSIKNIHLNTESGNITLNKNINITSNEAYFETKTGKIYVNSKMHGTLNITNEEGKISIPEFAGNINFTNTGRLEANCDNVGGNVKVKSSNGYIKIVNLGTTQVNVGGVIENRYGFIKRVGNGESISNYTNGNFTTYDTTDNTNITINNMTGNAAITSNTGFVNISNILKEALIETVSGKVTIGSTNSSVDITTDSGNVEVTQLSAGKNTTITTNNGKIFANFAGIGNANLNTTNSSINIKVATNIPFWFNYLTKNGLDVSWETSSREKTGSFGVAGGTESGYVISAIANNGSVNISDGFTA